MRTKITPNADNFHAVKSVSLRKSFKSPLFGAPSYSSTEQKAADLVTFTEEILNGQLYFLCSAQKYFCGMTLYCNRDTDYIGSYDMSGDNK